jgi:multicomponent K+:H+ antiporter subunit E
MRRLLPYPFASLILAGTWLLLNQSLSPGQLLLAVLFGLIGPVFLRWLDVPSARLRRPTAVLRLAAAVAADVLRSNAKVVWVLVRNDPARRPGFVNIPLHMRSTHGLAALACIITATPGTSWVTHDPDDGLLTIHVLDLADDDDWAEIIKTRYERRLMEIFE